jgi:hypothetical protein
MNQVIRSGIFVFILGFSSLAGGCGSESRRSAPPLCTAPCAVEASGFAAVMDMTADESGVYVVDDDAGVESLERIAAPGKRPLTIAKPASELELRVRGGKAYWLDWTVQDGRTTQLLSVDVAGGATMVKFGLDDAMVRLEVDDQNAYTQVPGAAAMQRIPLDGSGVAAYPGFGALAGLGLDQDALFVVDLGADGSRCQLRRQDTAGGDSTLVREISLVDEVCPVADLAAQAGNLFWKDGSLGADAVSIKTMPESGGDVVTLASGVSNWAGSFVADEANAYFGATLSDGRSGVIEVPVAGGEPTLFYAGEPTPITSDDTRVYFLRTEADGKTAVLSLPKR